MKRSAVVGAALVLVMCSAGSAMWWWGWQRAPREADVVRTADMLAAPSTWRLTDSTSRDRGPLCVDAECPSASRTWQAADAPQPGQLQDLITHAGWQDLRIDGDCVPRANRTGATTLCVVSASTGDLRITMTVSGPHGSSERPFTITLLVVPE